MNTLTNSTHPKKMVPQTTRNSLFRNTAIMTVVMALAIVAAIGFYLANRPVAAENSLSVTYSNALELQYAQPWQLPIAVPGDAQEQILLNCNSSLEMLYACKYGYGRP